LFYFEDDFKDNVIVHFFALLSPWRGQGAKKRWHEDNNVGQRGTGAK